MSLGDTLKRHPPGRNVFCQHGDFTPAEFAEQFGTDEKYMETILREAYAKDLSDPDKEWENWAINYEPFKRFFDACVLRDRKVITTKSPITPRLTKAGHANVLGIERSLFSKKSGPWVALFKEHSLDGGKTAAIPAEALMALYNSYALGKEDFNICPNVEEFMKNYRKR